MNFRIDYKYREKSNAFNNPWQHNFAIITAEGEEHAKEKLNKLWTAHSELVVKTVEPLTIASMRAIHPTNYHRI